MSKKTFADKLESLYEHYAPEMDHLPTADQIVSGVRFPDTGMTVEQQIRLLTSVIDEIVGTWKKYNKNIKNPLLINQVNNFYKFISVLDTEYELYGEELLHTKIKKLSTILPEFGNRDAFNEKYEKIEIGVFPR